MRRLLRGRGCGWGLPAERRAQTPVLPARPAACACTPPLILVFVCISCVCVCVCVCVCSASTATKRYMTLCRLERTDSCLSPLENATELAPLEERWREYFVFTFVS